MNELGVNGFYTSFWEQGEPYIVREYLEGFHYRCIDYLGQQIVPKRKRMNGECVLATVGITYLVVEDTDVAA